MPRLSQFYGITAFMNFGDRHPPHFHVRYGEYRAVFAIDPLRLLRGRLPARAEGLVLQWANLHQAELAANWERANRFQPVTAIEPLA